MKERALINKINKLMPEAKATSISEFYNDDSVGIWFKGSEDPASDGLPIFDYWSMDYDSFGVHPKLNKILESADWYAEPYDAGTLMAFEA